MYIAFQGPGYGCCASTYRFITQTDFSDGAMLASEFSHLSLWHFLQIQFPGRNPTVELLSDCEKTLEKLWNSSQNHSLGPKVTCTFAFQDPGHGCYKPTYRFITETEHSELCNACFGLRILAEGTSCR
jgi:hypothetical protein